MNLPPILAGILTLYAKRRRRALVLRGLGEAVVVQLVGTGLVALLDATLRPQSGLHLATVVVVYGATGAIVVWRILRPFLHRDADAAVARQVELAAGGLDERLSSAVELAARPPEGISAWMVERTVEAAATSAGTLDAKRLIDPRIYRRALTAAGVVVALIAGACLLPDGRGWLARAWWPALPRPSAVKLTVEPGDQRLAAGTDLTVTARALPDPGRAALVAVWEDGVEETLAMERAPDGHYELRVPVVTRPLRYRVEAADGTSRTFRVEVARPPLVEQVSLRITPPAYTGLDARDQDGGDAVVVNGSQVELRATLGGEPVAAATVRLPDGDRPATLDGTRLTYGLTPTVNTLWSLRLTGRSGLVAESAQKWLITVLPDQPPVAGLSGHALESGLVAADEVLALAVTARDDLGLKRVELVTQAGGSERQRLALDLSAEQDRRAMKRSATLDLATLGLQAGDKIEIQSLATDCGDKSGPSPALRLTVAARADAAGAAEAVRLRELARDLAVQAEVLRAMARSWSALVRGTGGDEATRRAEITALDARLRGWCDAVDAIAQRLATPDQGRGRAAEAAELTAWARGQRDQGCASLTGAPPGIATLQRGMTTPGQAEAWRSQDDAIAAFTFGRALGETGLTDINGFRRDLELAAATLEAAALTGGIEAAQARWRRSMAVLRGDRGWRGETMYRPGLAAEFFPGRDLAGEPRFREVAVPRNDNRDVPGLGRENWSVRWRGEVQVPRDGEWTFIATADDGVRLKINDQALLPGEAWRDQAATPYRGRIRLTAGWHAIVIEYFQGGGDSRFSLALGPDAEHVTECGSANLRTSAGAVADLAAEMAAVSPAAVEGALRQIAGALGATAPLPAAIARFAITTDAPDKGDHHPNELRRIANDLRPAVDHLVGRLDTVARWDLGTMADSEHGADQVVGVMRHARDLTRDQERHLRHARVKPGPLAALRQDLARVKDRIQELRRMQDHIQKPERLARTATFFLAGRGWIAQMAGETAAARSAFLSAAQRADTALAGRTAAVEASRALAALERAVAPALARLDGPRPNQHETADRLQQEHDQLMRLLNEAERWEDVWRRQEAAVPAIAALHELRAVRQEQKRGNQPAAERHYQEAKKLTQEADQVRAETGDQQAGKLAEKLGTSAATTNIQELTNALANAARPSEPWVEDLAKQAAEDLAATAKELAARTTTPERSATDLQQARTALALESERKHDQQGQAAALTRLSQDVAATAQRAADDRRTADAAQVAALAERAAALSGQRGEQAKGSEIDAALATRKPAGNDEAAQLEALAKRADTAVHDQKQRDPLEKDLDQLAAGADAADPTDAAAAQQAAAELARLQARAAALAQREAAARQQFAQAERGVAQGAPRLAEQAAEVKSHTKDQPLAGALQKTHDQLPGAAPAAQDLAAKAEGDQQAAPSAQLAQQGLAQADKLDQEVARPLARAFQQSSAAADDQGKREAAAIGRALSGMVAQSREAAQALAEAAADRAANDKALAAAQAAAQAQQAAAQAQPGQGQAAASAAVAEAAAEAADAIGSGQNKSEAFKTAAKILATAAQQARLDRALGQAPGSSPGQAKAQKPGQQPGKGSESEGERGSSAGLGRGNDATADQAAWARAQGANERKVSSAGIEQFGEEQQAAIRAYLKRVGEGR